MKKKYYIYIMTNKNNYILYTGITSDLKKRTYEHKNKIKGNFTCRYNVDKLLYFEVFNNPKDAIAREKQIKGGSRQKKINIVNSFNKTWRDLYDDI